MISLILLLERAAFAVENFNVARPYISMRIYCGNQVTRIYCCTTGADLYSLYSRYQVMLAQFKKGRNIHDLVNVT